jgi:hypothetical protein
LGSTRKLVTIGETTKKTKFTPPSPIKATPTTIASNFDDVSTTSFSNADDFMMTLSSQNKELLNNKSFLPKKDQPEGKTTATIAVIRGKPKDGHHRHRSNKHYKQKLVRVLLDSGSDSNLIFIKNDNPCCFPPQKGWFYSCGILQMGCSRPSVRLE